MNFFISRAMRIRSDCNTQQPHTLQQYAKVYECMILTKKKTEWNIKSESEVACKTITTKLLEFVWCSKNQHLSSVIQWEWTVADIPKQNNTVGLRFGCTAAVELRHTICIHVCVFLNCMWLVNILALNIPIKTSGVTVYPLMFLKHMFIFIAPFVYAA